MRKRDAVEGSQRAFFSRPGGAVPRPSARRIHLRRRVRRWRDGAPSIAAVNAVLAGYPGTTPYPGSGPYKGGIGVNTDGTIFTTVVPVLSAARRITRAWAAWLGTSFHPAARRPASSWAIISRSRCRSRSTMPLPAPITS